MVADGQAEVGHGDDDRRPVLGHQQPHQPRLEHVGREEGEKYDDQRKHQTHVLDTETEEKPLQLKSHFQFSLTYTNITRRITLSNLKSSEKVLMRRSIIKKVYWTINMDLYLFNESFIL